ncbi:MAG: O-antigen ligase family protein [Candidatus Fervidibacter sp.]
MAKQKVKVRRQQASRFQTEKEKWHERVKGWLNPIAFAAFCLALPYLTGTNDLFWTGFLLAAVLSLSAAYLVWFIWRKQPLDLTTHELFLFVFVAWQWLTVVGSAYRWASLLEALRWTAFAVVFFALRRLCDEHNCLWFAISFVVAATLIALQGLADYAVNASMGNFGWRIFGPFLQPNLFGNFLLLAFFIALGIAVQRPNGLVFAPAFVATLLFAAMTLTGSKGALLAWAAGVFVFGAELALRSTSFQVRKPILLMVALTPLAAMAVATILPPVRERFETLWSSQAHSWVFRWFVWKATFLGALSKPLMGFGAGTFEWAYPQFTTVSFTRHAHNGFLQVAIESGFVGLTLMILFFGTLIFKRPSKTPSSPLPDLPLRIGSVAAILAFCLHNLVETAWMTVANLLSLASVCGMASSFVKEKVQARWQWQFALLLPVLIGIWHSVAIARGAYFAQKARKETLPSLRLYWLERASEADPLNARHLIDRAILLEAWALAAGDEYRLKQALQLCNQAIRLQPTRSGNYKVKARILRELGRHRESEQALRTALMVNRTDTEAMLKLGELLEGQGKIKEAMGLYRRLDTLDKSAYGRYKPVDQWQDIFVAAGKIHLAEHLMRNDKNSEARRLLKEAETALKSFLDAYLPILKTSDPEAAESQRNFVELKLSEIQRLKRGQ